MSNESPGQFNDAERVKIAAADTEAMLDRVQSKVGVENVGNRIAELIDAERELTDPEKAELEAGLNVLESHAKTAVEEPVETKEKVNPYAPPEAAGAVKVPISSIDPVIGGSDQIDANGLPKSHRAPDVSKPEPQKGEYV